MFFKLADNTDQSSLASRMRQKRMAAFAQLVQKRPGPVSVLDIGGTAGFWINSAPEILECCQLTLLNLSSVNVQGLERATSVAGDARNLSAFADASFDICFSNSVIEHVGTLYDQLAMAREIRRVGKDYFVQTPNRFFPLEAHFLLPVWQFWPKRVRSKLHQLFDIGWMPKEPDWLRARADIEQIRLLSCSEMRVLFPDAEILREKIGPFTKSLTAVRRAD